MRHMSRVSNRCAEMNFERTMYHRTIYIQQIRNPISPCLKFRPVSPTMCQKVLFTHMCTHLKYRVVNFAP